MLLSIIIVSYNTKDLTLQTIKSVKNSFANSSPLKNQVEIILVDNNSQDGSVGFIKKLDSKTLPISIMANPQNLGFGQANNMGLAKAKGKYILFLNSDTIVMPGALEKLITAFEQNPVDETTSDLSSRSFRLDRLGILAASLWNQDGSYQPQGGKFPTLWSLFSHMTMLDDLPMIGRYFPSTQETGVGQQSLSQLTTNDLLPKNWVGGTAMMIRKKTLDEIGDFDPNIFMYGEDLELCIRAKNHHWDIAIHPDAKVVHLGSASSNTSQAIKGEFEGYQYIWSKHKPLWQIDLVRMMLKLGAALRVILFGTILSDQSKADVYRELL